MKKPVHTLAAAMFAAILSLPAAHAQGDAVQGEVRKIDEAAGKVTLKHGPIKNLGMDVGMTMVFRVADPAMLKEVKVGREKLFIHPKLITLLTSEKHNVQAYRS